MLGQLSLGDEFAGYEITKYLPSNFVVGGYLARDETGQKVSLKMFRDWKTLDPSSRDCATGYSIKSSSHYWKQNHFSRNHGDWRSFENEEGRRFDYFESRRDITRQLSGLSGFPQFVEAGIYNGTLYFVTKWIEGKDLKDPVWSDDLNPEEKLRLLPGLVCPLEKMHAINLLHNDVKTKNYIVGDDGAVTLIDFDLSLLGGRQVDRGRNVLFHQIRINGVGTLQYMAPEIIYLNKGKGFSEFADMWGLAVTAYFLLTKQMPFRGNSSDRLMSSIRHSSPPALAGLLPTDFPQRRRISDLVHWCLEKEWHKRPRAKQFRKELEGILTEAGID